jgi:hypothetical protein
MGVGGGDEGGDDAPAAPAGVGEHVPCEMNPAALPGGAQDLGSRGLDALMGVRDHQLHAAQAAPGELAQEPGPEGLRFRGADVHAENLAPAVAVDADGEDDGNRHDTAGMANLHVGRVEPEIGPVALDRPVEKGLHPAVDLLAQTRDLALRDAGHAHGLDQLVDRAGRDALDVGLLNDGGERLLGHPARLEEAREIRALPEPGDAELDRAGTSLPRPLAVAIALGEPPRALLPVGRTGQLADLQLHQAPGGKADHLAQKIGVRGFLDQPLQAHHLVGHRWSPDQVGVATRPYRHHR